MDPNRLEIEVKSMMPITTDGNGKEELGIAPMDIRGGHFTTTLKADQSIGLKEDTLHDSVPQGIWGQQGLQQADISSDDEMLVKNVKTGLRFTPPKDQETPKTEELDKGPLATNSDDAVLADKISNLSMKPGENTNNFFTPKNAFKTFTGLEKETLVIVDADALLHQELLQFELVNPEQKK